MPDLGVAIDLRPSTARAAHRELRSLLRLFRASYSWQISARTPWRMARYRAVQTRRIWPSKHPTRFRLSLQLPQLIKALNHPQAKVLETSTERNWCYSITIDNPEGPYHVFFEIRRASKQRRQWQDLQLVVESAYHQSDKAAPNLKGVMGFVLLCGKVYLGKAVSTKR
ncbi:hypothetical protein [Pseudomonas monteilii]|uniref:hypothetical protein n=1 Tax=Pseudomonas monteilii TaxID=76759 RepID=UPI001F47DB1B|nr:hypothetical protein [Pseudomonas monteilii]